MLQRLYNIFLLLGIALLLASCSDNDHPFLDDDTGGNNSGGSGQGGTGNNISMTMAIPLPEGVMSLRSYSGTNRGSGNEILIDGIRIVLYENSGATVIHCLDLNIKLDVDNSDNITVSGDYSNWFTSGESIFIQTKAKEIEQGYYDMLIIVNPNDKIKSLTEVGKSLSELDAPFDTSGMYKIIDGTAAYFLMLNHQGLIPVKPEDFYGTANQAENYPVFGKVERTVAKIECNYTGPTNIRSTAVAPYGRFVMLLDYNNQTTASWGMDYDIPDDCMDCPVSGCTGKFDRNTKRCSAKPTIHTYDGLGLVADRVRYMVATDLTWQIDVVNKKSYWLRQLSNKANGEMEEQGNVDRENFYAKDPNFSGFSGTTGLNSEFSYITTSSALDPSATGSTAKKLFPPSSYKYAGYYSWSEADAEPIYIPENTMAQSEQKGDVTTRVIFKAVLKREQFGVDESNPNPTYPTSIGDFFVFKGGNANIEDYKYNNYNKDGSTFYILRPEDVKIYASGVSADNIHIYLRDGIQAAIAQFNLDNPSFDWSNISANANPAISEKLIFYKNGEMYYEVPIEHFSVSEVGFGKYGRFGVVRNNWYKLNVENIISIGWPTIPTAASTLIEDADSNQPNIRSATGSDYQVRNQSIIF